MGAGYTRKRTTHACARENNCEHTSSHTGVHNNMSSRAPSRFITTHGLLPIPKHSQRYGVPSKNTVTLLLPISCVILATFSG